MIDPGLLAVVGEVAPGTRLLDLGCGNGYLSRRFARHGAKVVGVDLSAELIDAARSREQQEPVGVAYLRRDAARLEGLDDGAFDLAVANMSLQDIEPAEGAIREVARVVRDGGRFVFSLSHPCFDIDTRSAWSIEVPSVSGAAARVYRKVTDYRTPHSDVYPWLDTHGGVVATTRSYHRPLEWYASALSGAGWVITDLAEPTPGPEFTARRIQKEWIEEIPMHLVVGARREFREERSGQRSPSIHTPDRKTPGSG